MLATKLRERENCSGCARTRWKGVSRYQGTLKAGKREGKGVWTHRSGSEYKGEWKDNLKHGKGEYWVDDGNYYKGEFRNDKPEGKGVWIGADGTIYEGAFRGGKKDGSFRITYPDASSRDSIWRDDVEVNAPPPRITRPS